MLVPDRTATAALIELKRGKTQGQSPAHTATRFESPGVSIGNGVDSGTYATDRAVAERIGGELRRGEGLH